MCKIKNPAAFCDYMNLVMKLNDELKIKQNELLCFINECVYLNDYRFIQKMKIDFIDKIITIQQTANDFQKKAMEFVEEEICE